MCRDCTMWRSGNYYGECHHPAMQIQSVGKAKPPPKIPLTTWATVVPTKFQFSEVKNEQPD